MEITSIDHFLNYYDKVKKRTQRLFDYIPEDKIEWTYREGKFTVGDIIRHLANLERYMFAENVQFKGSRYVGCGTEYANGLENVAGHYHQLYQESRAIFARIPDPDLVKKCKTPAGIEISVWKWLRAMLEHEIHHRGQLYIYLGIIDAQTPPIFGLTSEEVSQNSIKD